MEIAGVVHRDELQENVPKATFEPRCRQTNLVGIASSLTAGIATALTLSQLATASVQTPSDFPSHAIGVIRGTSTVPFVHR